MNSEPFACCLHETTDIARPILFVCNRDQTRCSSYIPTKETRAFALRASVQNALLCRRAPPFVPLSPIGKRREASARAISNSSFGRSRNCSGHCADYLAWAYVDGRRAKVSPVAVMLLPRKDGPHCWFSDLPLLTLMALLARRRAYPGCVQSRRLTGPCLLRAYYSQSRDFCDAVNDGSLARPAGFEPATSCLEGLPRSVQRRPITPHPL